MDIVGVICLALIFRESADAAQNDKRLVLHSDTDVVHEINKLRTELNNQKSDIQNMEVRLTDKNVAIQNLTTSLNDQKTYVTSTLAEKDKSIQNMTAYLTSKLTEKDVAIQNLSTVLGEQKTYMTSNLAEKDSEIQTLQSDYQTTLNNLTNLLNHNEAKISALEQTITQQQKQPAGSSYERWGRTSCPGNGTTLAYSGYMAGAKYSETGGATNYLCLTGQPTWDYYEDGTASASRIYGVEYQFSDHNAASRTKFFGTDLLDDDAPCAVCHTVRGTNIMIPGRTDCYDGWTKEYSGYIVSEHYGHVHGTEYVCLDRRPEVVVGGKNSADESILWLVEGRCGKSLECPPYVNGRELACVVCSA